MMARRQYIGAAMLAMPLIGLFVLFSFAMGLLAAAAVFGCAFLLAAFMMAALSLLLGEKPFYLISDLFR